MIGLLLIAAVGAAPESRAVSADDVVVRGQVPPHCHPRSGDPLDEVRNLPDKWVTLHLQRDGSVVIAQDGLHFEGDVGSWQRSGSHMGDYVFRTPTDGSPLCMGSRSDRGLGGVQLRRQLDPRDFRGQHVRFTAFAASRGAKWVTFWLNGGGGEKAFVHVGWGGTREWTPVSLDVRVSDQFALAMYGFTLSGSGDVWLYQPRLDIIRSDGKRALNPPDRR